MSNKFTLYLFMLAGMFFWGCSDKVMASGVDLKLTANIVDGTCNLEIINHFVNLYPIYGSDTTLSATSHVNPKTFELRLLDCEPGPINTTPMLNITGDMAKDNVIWRDSSVSDENNAGPAYGFTLKAEQPHMICQYNAEKTSIVKGYCTLGEKGGWNNLDVIKFSMGYAKNMSNGSAAKGKIKSSIHFSFEYH